MASSLLDCHTLVRAIKKHSANPNTVVCLNWSGQEDQLVKLLDTIVAELTSARTAPSDEKRREALEAVEAIEGLISKNGSPTEYRDTVYVTGLLQKCVPSVIRAALLATPERGEV